MGSNTTISGDADNAHIAGRLIVCTDPRYALQIDLGTKQRPPVQSDPVTLARLFAVLGKENGNVKSVSWTGLTRKMSEALGKSLVALINQICEQTGAADGQMLLDSWSRTLALISLAVGNL